MIKTVSTDDFLDIAEKELYHQSNFIFKFENPDPELRQSVLKKLFRLLPDDLLLSFDPNNYLGNVYDDYCLKYVNWLKDIDSYVSDHNVDLVYVMNTDSYRYSSIALIGLFKYLLHASRPMANASFLSL